MCSIVLIFIVIDEHQPTVIEQESHVAEFMRTVQMENQRRMRRKKNNEKERKTERKTETGHSS